MRITILILLSFLLHSTFVNAQQFSDTTRGQIIGKTMRGSGFSYYVDGQRLNMHEVRNMFYQNPKAYKKYIRSRQNGQAAKGLAFAGGFFVGYGLVPLVAYGYKNLVPFIAGGAMFLAAIPIISLSGEQEKEAVSIYNDGIRTRANTTLKRRKEYYILATGNSLGLAMKF